MYIGPSDTLIYHVIASPVRGVAIPWTEGGTIDTHRKIYGIATGLRPRTDVFFWSFYYA